MGEERTGWAEVSDSTDERFIALGGLVGKDCCAQRLSIQDRRWHAQAWLLTSAQPKQFTSAESNWAPHKTKLGVQMEERERDGD